MLNLYQFTISLFVDRNLPPDKKLPVFTKWVYSLLRPIQIIQKFMNYFINGYSDISEYNIASPYSSGEFVHYQNKIYFCWKDAIAGITPTNKTNWVWVMNGKVGMQAIQNYTSSKLVLELILNTYFETAFTQPPALPPIRITTVGNSNKYFTIFDGTQGTAIFDGGILNGDVAVYGDVSLLVANNYSFTIKVPSATWATIAANDSLREQVVKAVIQPFVYSGITFNAIEY